MLPSDLATRLGRHIEALTSAGPRHRGNPAGVRTGRDYIESTLADYQVALSEQRYGRQPYQANFIAEFNHDHPAESGVVDLCAHWDSVATSPGADDNASGVAGLLEIAAELARQPGNHRVRLCFFGEEEQGGFPGSSAHVQQCLNRGEHILAALVLEMIGYRDCSPGSQTLPESASAALSAAGVAAPQVGNFIAVVGDTGAEGWVQELAGAAGRLKEALPVVPLAAPAGLIADAGRSDQATYWRYGLPGIMITDTANFRNPHYHQPTDTLSTVDLQFAAQVVRMVLSALTSGRSALRES